MEWDSVYVLADGYLLTYMCFSFNEYDRPDKDSNIPGTAGGPGGRDRTLPVKSRKIAKKSVFFS